MNSSMMMTFKGIITGGDPNGIGPEVILKSIKQFNLSQFLLVSNFSIFSFWNDKLKINAPLNPIQSIENIRDFIKHDHLNILDLPYDREVHIGKLESEAGAFALTCIDKAIDILKSGYSDTLITCPVNKESIITICPQFMGHTEYLADAFSIPEVTMLMSSEKVSVATVTTHIPIKDVPASLSQSKIEQTIAHCSSYFTIKGDTRPIAVCGLNPHAGEGGKVGNEEDIIISAIKKCVDKGIQVEGPYSADTLFTQIHTGKYSAYISMYHDQGLIPFKLMSFGEGVNITLGLPIKRISVDHGTAFDIAGKGIADTKSLLLALKWAENY